jgi:hypothetical protein
VIVVKHKYIPGRGPKSGGKVVSIGKALAHLRYIQHRPGPDREKGGRELFNDRDDVDAKDLREAIKRLGGNRVIVHKLVLAPEINVADKKAFTREVMQNLCRDKGLDLEWIATDHSNTDHHHLHVIILGKDRNGTDVRFDMKDVERTKEYGDRYLERWHPRELERSKREREDKERERLGERERSREVAKEVTKEVGKEPAKSERADNVINLPWMHKKIVREQIEPYRDWVEKQKQRSGSEAREEQLEKPFYQDTIEAAGKDWSRDNSLDELRGLNKYLWDNKDERIPKDDYKKLARWIKDKERVRLENRGETEFEKEKEPGSDDKSNSEKDKEFAKIEPGRASKFEIDKEKLETIESKGEQSNKQDPYNKLKELIEKSEKEEKIPFDDYQKVRVMMEDADRARWDGALDKQLQLTHKKFERSKTMEQLKEQEGGRVLNPVQEEVMRNPIFGLWMKFASLSNELVRSIPLDDRLRDPVKEGRDELEAGKKGIEGRELDRIAMPKSGMEPEQLQGLQKAEKKDRDNRERIEQDIEKNKVAKHEELKKQKRDRQDREPDYDVFDPWGMY